jgi:pyruvate/2-oxoglutarate dehydrogenase complex dihydrolipoamide acyltransferase (E2) component
MGEGIRNAKIVSLLKNPGEQIQLDDELCEVETDKAVYPIESAHVGVLKAWQCNVDDVVDVGRQIGVMTVEPTAVAAPAPEPEKAPAPAPESLQQLQRRPRFEPPAPHPPGAPAAPALSPAITRRLAGVVPANIQIDAPWKAIHAAREAAKEARPDLSPSLMLAWCVVRAMEQHAAFRRVVTKDGSIAEIEKFDLGVAVALEGDRLATAVIHAAAALDWPGFAAAYAHAIAEARGGKVEDVQTPLNITSLGAFGVEVATPIVVPPSMATLFIGKAHERMINDGGTVYPAEVVTLSLTFDHRVVNGAGAAAFLNEVKSQIAEFRLPA